MASLKIDSYYPSWPRTVNNNNHNHDLFQNY